MNKTKKLKIHEELYNKAKTLLEAGDFESAKSKLSFCWDEVGIYPTLEGFPEILRANLLLITGALTGWIGSAEQKVGAQETAKDLISEASGVFESLELFDRWAESRGELALCYWREGSFSESRIILQDALDKVTDTSPNIKGLLLLRLVNVEISTYNYINAQALLGQASKLVSEKGTNLLCGKVYFHYALVMRRLAEEEDSSAKLSDSLEYYKMARSYYHKANHKLYEAMVDNNIGYLLCELGEFAASKLALEKALNYFTEISDKGRISLVRDNQARLCLAEDKLDKAEQIARLSVDIVRQGDEQSSLAEYMTTLGVILARKKDFLSAKEVFLQASDIAYKIGDLEASGIALLTLIEELEGQVLIEELIEYYLKADELLSNSARKTVNKRLKKLAKKLLLDYPAFTRVQNEHIVESTFVGTSSIATNIINEAKSLANTTECVYILGETGTGKETLARQIYSWSGNKGEFISVNCEFFDGSDISQYLFPISFESKSHSDYEDKTYLNLSKQGTIYISEVDKLRRSDQARLLQLLEDISSYSKLHTSENVDLRFIVSSCESLENLVRKNSFRKDLFYKLNTFNIYIPSFRERKEDVLVITDYLLKTYQPKWTDKLDESFYNFIERQTLYGNGYELKAIIDKTIWKLKTNQPLEYRSESKYIKATKNMLLDNWDEFSLPEIVKGFEAEIITKALRESEGRITKAAKLLGITHQNLSAHLKNRHKNLKTEKKTRKKRTQ